jgi:glycosyltransferase involved in cell wall biosynthesis
MKVLLLIDNLGSGGAQRQIILLAKGLMDNKVDVHLMTYNSGDYFLNYIKDNKINHFHIPKNGRIGLNVVIELIKKIRKNKYDFVISFLHTPNFYNIISKLFAFTSTKHITSERSKSEKKGIIFYKQLFTHLFSDHLICNSYHEGEFWIKNSVFLNKKVTVIYNGVELNLFNKRSYKSLNYKAIVVGSVGPSKNGICVLEALKILKSEINFEITWLGNQVKHIKKYKEYLDIMNSFIEENNLQTSWKWELPIESINGKYHNYDFLILSSKVEGLPNVVCEAMASGTIVIISNVLDHPHITDFGKFGILFDPNNSMELADSIRKFYLMDISDVDILSTNIHMRAHQLFSHEKMVNTYLSLLTQMKS